jgi:hypothetical protein
VSYLDVLIEREREKERKQASTQERRDLASEIRRIECELRPFARRLRRMERERQGHLAVYFPVFWYFWRAQCRTAYLGRMGRAA